MMKTDAELLHDYTDAGSDGAFQELVARHLGLVYSVALRQTLDPETAKDISQSVFADLARKAKTFSSSVKLVGWLHRSAFYAARKSVRDERRRKAREQHAMDIHRQESSPSPEDSWNDVRHLVDQSIMRLAEKDRHAVLLRFFQQKDLKEVGQALGISEYAAQKRIARALERMRLFLTKRGAVISGAMLSTLLMEKAVEAVPVGFASSIATTSLTMATSSTGFVFNMMEIMNLSKVKLALGVSLLAGAAAIPFTIQHRELAETRLSNIALTEQLQRLEQEKAALGQQLTRSRNENESLKSQVVELPRLRGELAALKKNPEIAAPGRAQEAPQKVPLNTRFFAVDFNQLTNSVALASYGTPVRAFELLLSAYGLENISFPKMQKSEVGAFSIDQSNKVLGVRATLGQLDFVEQIIQIIQNAE